MREVHRVANADIETFIVNLDPVWKSVTISMTKWASPWPRWGQDEVGQLEVTISEWLVVLEK